MDWQPSASIDALKKRAELLKILRDFFYARDVVEVETPLMCAAGTTDVYLDSFLALRNSVDASVDGRPIIDTRSFHYLQTSPEFAMKRLLAAGIGDCYQICKAFRVDEVGKNHNPEFTMLEWYRLNFDHHQLMDDMDALLQLILKCGPANRVSYQELFLEHLHIDPHLASIDDLIKISPELCAVLNKTIDTKDDYLMLLLSHLIEPKIGFDRPCFIYDFPATQAALAKLRDVTVNVGRDIDIDCVTEGRANHGGSGARGQGCPLPRNTIGDNISITVAERFEVYVNGIELANGFHELQNANEQLKRFKNDNKKRRELGKPEVAIDYRLIDALKHGLPNCAGVALGVDRLIMLALQKEKLEHVLSFHSNII